MTAPISMATEQTTMPILSAVSVMSKNFTFHRPNMSGSDFEVGPKIIRNNWLPIRLIARVAIMPLEVKAGLSWRGMKTRRQTIIPATAPARIPVPAIRNGSLDISVETSQAA